MSGAGSSSLCQDIRLNCLACSACQELSVDSLPITATPHCQQHQTFVALSTAFFLAESRQQTFMQTESRQQTCMQTESR